MIPNDDSPSWLSSSSCSARIIRCRRPIMTCCSLSPRRLKNRAPGNSPYKRSFKSISGASIIQQRPRRRAKFQSHRVNSRVYSAGFATTFAFRGRSRTSTRIKPHSYISFLSGIVPALLSGTTPALELHTRACSCGRDSSSTLARSTLVIESTSKNRIARRRCRAPQTRRFRHETDQGDYASVTRLGNSRYCTAGRQCRAALAGDARSAKPLLHTIALRRMRLDAAHLKPKPRRIRYFRTS